MSRRSALATVAAVAIVQSVVLWHAHPHALAWSNPLFPGESWQLAADSNVDWGQDFYRLQAWAQDKGKVYVSYFGFGPSYDLDELPNAVSAHPASVWSEYLRGPPSGSEYMAVSASNLNAYARDDFGLLRQMCPVDKIGETILVYRFPQIPETLRAQPEGLPHGLCENGAYSTRTMAGSNGMGGHGPSTTH
jgi:hypothetical protein